MLKKKECARNAECGASTLVKTGNGLSALNALAKKEIRPEFHAENLLDAAHWILRHRRR